MEHRKNRLKGHGKPSPAFDCWKAQRDDSGSFLALLCEPRNAGTHRYYLNKVTHASSHSSPHNIILAPCTGEPPQRYPELRAIDLMLKQRVVLSLLVGKNSMGSNLSEACYGYETTKSLI